MPWGRDPLCVLSYYKILTCILRSRVDILGDAKLYTKLDGDSFNNIADDFQVFPECFSFRYPLPSQPFYGSPPRCPILMSDAFAPFISPTSTINPRVEMLPYFLLLPRMCDIS